MWARIGLAALIYIAAVLETSAQVTPAGRITVCWLCLTAVVAIWTMSPGEAAAWGGLIGLVGDALSSGPLGPQLLGLATLGFAFATLRKRWEWRSLAALTLIAMLQTASLLGLMALLRQFTLPLPAETDVPYVIVGCAVATGVCAMVVTVLSRAARSALISLIVPQRA
jgi:rod shape-determining protein MreD